MILDKTEKSITEDALNQRKNLELDKKRVDDLLKKFTNESESQSAYICHLKGERVIIIGKNISDVMDKMGKIVGDSIFGYSMESHSTIRLIF